MGNPVEDQVIPNALLSLAERVETATGPDRALDAMIHHATKGGIGTGYAANAPAFTSSLDAALTLVPDELDFGCGRGIDTELGANKAICHAWVGEGEGDLVFAETVALALTAAALRALADRLSA